MKVPYYKQEFPWSCFPTCIRMVLEYHGIKKEEKELRLLLKATFGGWWYYVEMGLESIGLHFYWLEGFSLDKLEELIKNETPVIVSLKISDHPNHTAVVTDITDEFVALHDPEKGADIQISTKPFLKAWNKRKNIAGYLKKI